MVLVEGQHPVATARGSALAVSSENIFSIAANFTAKSSHKSVPFSRY